ncbi:uncharacterized protein CTRU02_200037 [Colletotrichum truncatum]|uniref:Uncharacterized protein n=1 Tax=Colletotrichum truncatum TaxID=5467 RepID=A0ACC3ZDH9_COLTU
MASGEDNKHDSARNFLWTTVDSMESVIDGKKKDEIAAAQAFQKSVESLSSGSHQPANFDLQDNNYFVDNGRRILKPISRMGRAGVKSSSAMSDLGLSKKPFVPTGLSENMHDTLGSFATSGSFDDPFTTEGPTVQLAGELLRNLKALRLSTPETNLCDADGNKPGPGFVHRLDFDPSPKHYLALGVKGKSSKKSTNCQSGTVTATPRDLSNSFAEYKDTSVPPRPCAMETATPTTPEDNEQYKAYEFMNWDDSPSVRPLRRHMANLDVASRSLERPVHHPVGPRPFIGYSGPPQTPTKQTIRGKRARREFENTTSLSGRDVAREREILSQFAATALMGEDEEDEDEEDDEETPKASILNRHLEKTQQETSL